MLRALMKMPGDLATETPPQSEVKLGKRTVRGERVCVDDPERTAAGGLGEEEHPQSEKREGTRDRIGMVEGGVEAWKLRRHKNVGVYGNRIGDLDKLKSSGDQQAKKWGSPEAEKQTGGKLGRKAQDDQTEQGGGVDLRPRGSLLGADTHPDGREVLRQDEGSLKEGPHSDSRKDREECTHSGTDRTREKSPTPKPLGCKP